MHVFDKTLTGKTMTVSDEPSDTVEAMMLQIQVRRAHPARCFCGGGRRGRGGVIDGCGARSKCECTSGAY